MNESKDTNEMLYTIRYIKKSITNFLSGLYFCVLLLIDPKWVLNVVPHQKKSNSKLQLKISPSLQVVKYSYFIFASEKNINLCGCRMCSIFGRGCVNFIWFIFNVEASTCRPPFSSPCPLTGDSSKWMWTRCPFARRQKIKTQKRMHTPREPSPPQTR